MPSAKLEQDAHTCGLRERVLPLSSIGSPQQMQICGLIRHQLRVKTPLVITPAREMKTRSRDKPSPLSAIATVKLLWRLSAAPCSQAACLTSSSPLQVTQIKAQPELEVKPDLEEGRFSGCGKEESPAMLNKSKSFTALSLRDPSRIRASGMIRSGWRETLKKGFIPRSAWYTSRNGGVTEMGSNKSSHPL
jgi:hypothetical protein